MQPPDLAAAVRHHLNSGARRLLHDPPRRRHPPAPGQIRLPDVQGPGPGQLGKPVVGEFVLAPGQQYGFDGRPQRRLLLHLIGQQDIFKPVYPIRLQLPGHDARKICVPAHVTIVHELGFGTQDPARPLRPRHHLLAVVFPALVAMRSLVGGKTQIAVPLHIHPRCVGPHFFALHPAQQLADTFILGLAQQIPQRQVHPAQTHDADPAAAVGRAGPVKLVPDPGNTLDAIHLLAQEQFAHMPVDHRHRRLATTAKTPAAQPPIGFDPHDDLPQVCTPGRSHVSVVRVYRFNLRNFHALFSPG